MQVLLQKIKMLKMDLSSREIGTSSFMKEQASRAAEYSVKHLDAQKIISLRSVGG